MYGNVYSCRCIKIDLSILSPHHPFYHDFWSVSSLFDSFSGFQEKFNGERDYILFAERFVTDLFQLLNIKYDYEIHSKM